MPLSEQEQKLLDEMERSLYHNDADFVSAVGAGRGRLNYGSLVLGVLLAIVGLGVVIVGVVIHVPLVGILGFALMFTGVLVALRPSRGLGRMGRSSARSARSPGSPQNRAGFMDRLNDRWDNRDEKNE
ncbi:MULTISPECIES: DUF3040 domain-containing protein [Subtercola]|uniref:DUF3040 domain-containing protein n=1 Tax=Subtercola vilae TaxID=2056433 RepID=A0A4T2BTN2_9MICO|nr:MULTISPECIES: DUF3040 domain-containing protein [Subtercola]MEA9983917.1 DUF3040 domain-containing protein [Subtercola sp. RTI3]TIH34459.1 DUF3040 domain-containing protein [Subtercola vilae]